MKLEIKHIAGYLPYGLKYILYGIKTNTVNEISFAMAEDIVHTINTDSMARQLVLRPMSDLYKEINGVVGIVELAKIEHPCSTYHILRNKVVEVAVVNCIGNPALFRAVTAVRDDSDYMQWFTDGKEFILCDREDWIDMISCLCCGGRYNYNRNGELSEGFHKATLAELQEHFK